MVVNRNIPYFNNNYKNYNFNYNYNINGNKIEGIKNFIDAYINEKYGKDIMIKGYKIVDKIINNLKIYTKNDENINKKLILLNMLILMGVNILRKSQICIN